MTADQPKVEDMWPIPDIADMEAKYFNMIGPIAKKVTEGIGLVFSERLRIYGRWRGQGPLEPVILAFVRDKLRLIE